MQKLVITLTALILTSLVLAQTTPEERVMGVTMMFASELNGVTGNCVIFNPNIPMTNGIQGDCFTVTLSSDLARSFLDLTVTGYSDVRWVGAWRDSDGFMMRMFTVDEWPGVFSFGVIAVDAWSAEIAVVYDPAEL